MRIDDDIARALRDLNPGEERVAGGGKLAIVGGALMVIGAVLPWVVLTVRGVTETSQSGMMRGDGVIYLGVGILVAAIGLFVVLGHPKAAPTLLVLAGVTVVGLTALEYFGEIKHRAETIVETTLGSQIASVGVGIYALFAGGLAAACAGVMARRRGRGTTNVVLALLASLAVVVVLTTLVVIMFFSGNTNPGYVDWYY